ncbi:pectinesterase inhibitor 10-like [Amaranthus tricolor]|uniref:pectinesterase inhibitor 10-like n=1 Tax=Amaranthus tricolor TaxID=29722 RepID=UPI00258FD787|nr:pectinesterase inhibitor 10-like [Amaranthus tricolor]
MSQIHLIFLLFIYLLISPSFSSTKTNNTTYSFVISACNTTRYPTLCTKTCLPYATKIDNDPRKLAGVSLSAALTATTTASSALTELSNRENLGEYEAGVVQDCIENVGDSIDDVKKAIKEVNDLGEYGNKEINTNKFRFKVSNIQTWMSAALTNLNTCRDGIGEGEVSSFVKSRIKKITLRVMRLTSIALSLCNHLQI